MRFVMNFSIMALKPLAPVFFSIALSAIHASASLSKVRVLPLMAKMDWYWRMMAFFGSVRILMRSSLFRSLRGVITGRRPMNSGIMP